MARVHLLIRAALILLLPVAVAAQEAPPETKLRDVERELGSTQSEAGQLEAEMASIKTEKAELSKKLIDTAARIQARESQITSGETRLAHLGVEERDVNQRLEQRKGALIDMLAALQRLEREPPPVLAVRPGDAVAAIRSAMLLSKVVPQIRAEADTLARELRQLARLRNDIVEEQRQLALNKDQLSREQSVIERLLEVKSKLASRTAAEIRAARDKAEQLAAEAGSLRELLTRLEAERGRAEAAKAEALAQAEAREAEEVRLAALQPDDRTSPRKPEPAGTPTRRNVPSVESVPAPTAEERRLALARPDRMQPSASFANIRGKLARPARGVLFRKYGTADGYGGRTRGMSLTTRTQAQVTSPSDGWVMFAGTFRGYGQLLIIDPGDGYHILLAGMERIHVSAGQFVLAGEPVGNMGVEAIQSAAIGRLTDRSKPLLYVEFQKDGKSIDPQPWWQADNMKARG